MVRDPGNSSSGLIPNREYRPTIHHVSGMPPHPKSPASDHAERVFLVHVHDADRRIRARRDSVRPPAPGVQPEAILRRGLAGRRHRRTSRRTDPLGSTSRQYSPAWAAYLLPLPDIGLPFLGRVPVWKGAVYPQNADFVRGAPRSPHPPSSSLLLAAVMVFPFASPAASVRMVGVRAVLVWRWHVVPPYDLPSRRLLSNGAIRVRVADDRIAVGPPLSPDYSFVRT